jgi:hypothetical protein
MECLNTKNIQKKKERHNSGEIKTVFSMIQQNKTSFNNILIEVFAIAAWQI